MTNVIGKKINQKSKMNLDFEKKVSKQREHNQQNIIMAETHSNI